MSYAKGGGGVAFPPLIDTYFATHCRHTESIYTHKCQKVKNWTVEGWMGCVRGMNGWMDEDI